VSILVGTADAGRAPETTRGVGAQVIDGGAKLAIYIPDVTSQRTLANVRATRAVAATFSRPHDHKTLQIKGKTTDVRPADESDRAVIERYRALLAEQLAFVGIPRRMTRRFAHRPCHRVELAVEGVFERTPGPGAGAPLRP
jgi:hypothetical protein